MEVMGAVVGLIPMRIVRATRDLIVMRCIDIHIFGNGKGPDKKLI
jgi:hypothetical protein